MIKKLSPEERAEVMAFLRKQNETQSEAGRVEEAGMNPKINFLPRLKPNVVLRRSSGKITNCFDAWRNERRRRAAVSFVGDRALVAPRIIATAWRIGGSPGRGCDRGRFGRRQERIVLRQRRPIRYCCGVCISFSGVAGIFHGNKRTAIACTLTFLG